MVNPDAEVKTRKPSLSAVATISFLPDILELIVDTTKSISVLVCRFTVIPLILASAWADMSVPSDGVTKSTLTLTTVLAVAVTPALALLIANALLAAEEDEESPIATPFIVTLSDAANASEVTTTDLKATTKLTFLSHWFVAITL